MATALKWAWSPKSQSKEVVFLLIPNFSLNIHSFIYCFFQSYVLHVALGTWGRKRYGCHFRPLNMFFSITLFYFLPQFNTAPQRLSGDSLSSQRLSLLPTQKVSSFLSSIQTVNGFRTQGISFISCGDHMYLDSMLLLTPYCVPSTEWGHVKNAFTVIAVLTRK